MLTYTLPFPPSVNTYYRRGAHATYMSKGGRVFKQQVADIVSQAGGRIDGRLSVFLSLSCPTKRAYDIDGRIKATLDALQDAGVFADDEQVDQLMVVRHPVSKGGYCRVVITRMDEKKPED